MITTLLLLLWLIPIAVNIYIDKDGKKPNYLMVFVVRGMAAILHGILFNPQNWNDYFPVFIFQITSFWLLFEIGLNLLRGREVFYYDRKEHDSGWIDKIFDKLGNGAHLAAKVGCFVLMILSIIVIYAKHG